MTSKCAQASRSAPGTYKTGTLTEKNVWVCEASPRHIFVTTRKTEALETARRQAAGVSEENRDHLGGILGSREEGWGPSFLVSASPSPTAKRKKEDHILAFAFICVNISKYTQGINSSSSSRQEGEFGGQEKGTYPFLFSDHEPSGYSAPNLF